MKEIWKDIKGYERLYQISNYGRVKSLVFNNNICKKKREKILSPTDNGKGYLIIGLRKNGKRKNYYIHRLVAEHFLKNDKNLKEVNHINFNKKNNSVENLEWVTKEKNIKHYHDSNFSKQIYNNISNILHEKYDMQLKNNEEKIIQLYTQGDMTIEEISMIVQIGSQRISKLLDKNNINKRKHVRNKFIYERDIKGRFTKIHSGEIKI